MTEIKLTQLDKKLLSYLYHNSREPSTKIAKNLKISRELKLLKTHMFKMIF